MPRSYLLDKKIIIQPEILAIFLSPLEPGVYYLDSSRIGLMKIEHKNTMLGVKNIKVTLSLTNFGNLRLLDY